MRWRNGLIGLAVCVMSLLLLWIEATCLNPQHRKQTLNTLIALNSATHYRSQSGLVLWPVFPVAGLSNDPIFEDVERQVAAKTRSFSVRLC
jgi:hypothetical protein